jgi:predicted DCC family thiol-disulfide oxidoreductase YuxK
MSNYRIEVFHDGDCPLCEHEIGMLRRLDRRGNIRFTDIAADGFDASSYGRTQAEFMARIQGRSPDGTWIDGVEVFRQLYAAVGLGPLVAVTRWPGLRWLADRAYDWFAKNRLRLTGRCEDGVCTIPEPVERAA